MNYPEISVNVVTRYLPAQSVPDESRYAFSYTITIRNDSLKEVKLLYRHWIITDANGHIRDISGEGVVGTQPVILPDKNFTYTSGVILNTPIGSMYGEYLFIITDNTLYFKAPIKPFQLAIPHIIH